MTAFMHPQIIRMNSDLVLLLFEGFVADGMVGRASFSRGWVKKESVERVRLPHASGRLMQESLFQPPTTRRTAQ